MNATALTPVIYPTSTPFGTGRVASPSREGALLDRIIGVSAWRRVYGAVGLASGGVLV